MKDEELLIILAVVAGAFFLMHGMPAPVAQPAAQPVVVPTPTPAVSPYYGYPPNIMNPSPSANTGQSWSTQDTAALITGLTGLGTSLINNYS